MSIVNSRQNTYQKKIDCFIKCINPPEIPAEFEPVFSDVEYLINCALQVMYFNIKLLY
jgi:hypothetical protein